MTHRRTLRTGLNFNKISGLDAVLDDFIAGSDRKLEEQSEYFRRQAGWFDDDHSMANYNSKKTTESYPDDNNLVSDGGKGAGVEVFSILLIAAKLVAVLVGSVIAIKAVSRSIIRARHRRSTRNTRGRRRRRSISSRSLSKTRSKSSMHTTDLSVESAHETRYDIMEDTTNHSSRSRSKSRARGEKIVV